MDTAISADSAVGRLEQLLIMRGEAAHGLALLLPALTHWEDEHLLRETPTAADRAAYPATSQHLLRCAKVLSLATRQPDFPDRKLAGLLAAVQAALEFKLQL